MLWTDNWGINRVVTAVAAAVLLVACISVSAGNASELLYKSWDKRNWVAKYQGSQFIHSPENSSRGYGDPVIRYLGWDGQQFAARLERGIFLIAPNGDFNSSRTRRLDYIRYLDWHGRVKTAQWRREDRRIEVKRPDGVMIVASSNLQRITDLRSRHNICISSSSQVALEEYVREFHIQPPKFRRMPAGEFVPALEKGVCHAGMAFATHDAVWKFASRFERYGFRIVGVPAP